MARPPLLLLLLTGCTSMLPGAETTSLDDLHPRFASRVERVVERLEAEGHEVRVGSAWRSPRRQEAIFALGRLAEELGRAPTTKVRGGGSCHNQSKAGQPASAAVDLRTRRRASTDEQAAFYQALGRAAGREGLRWGGSWKRSHPTWARYDLGWDPGHVEDRTLCRQLRGS